MRIWLTAFRADLQRQTVGHVPPKSNRHMAEMLNARSCKDPQHSWAETTLYIMTAKADNLWARA
jgi:hypothetical protein